MYSNTSYDISNYVVDAINKEYIKNYHIFNGLGTKGYLLAPKLAEEFVDYLLNGTALLEEMNIKRFEP